MPKKFAKNSRLSKKFSPKDRQLKKYQEQVNNELEKYSGKKDVPEKILNNSMEYSLMAGGKRLRPILVIATYEIFGKNINKYLLRFLFSYVKIRMTYKRRKIKDGEKEI